MIDSDVHFFAQHPDRQARIRLPSKVAHRDQQRAVRYLDECEIEFRHLGGHDPKRRRIIAYKLPVNHPSHPNHIMKIPFLTFADESISDDDATLLPIVHKIMLQAAT